MRRVYLRLWGFTAVLFVLGLVALESLIVVESYTDAAGYYEQFFRGGLASSAALHDQGTPADELAAMWGVPVERVAGPEAVAGAVPISEGPGQVHYYEREGAEGMVVRTPRGQWLHVGPFAPYPMPDPWPRLVLLTTLAVLLVTGTGLIMGPLDRAQRAIAATAHRIGEGDLSARVRPEDVGAAPGVGEAINAMAVRIQALVEDREHILRAVSHELRTPIARLRIGVHLLATAEGDREAREAALDDDLQELDDLVEELLVHARLQDPTRPLARAPVELEAALRQVVDRIAVPEALDVRIEVEVRGLHADPALFRRAIGNLVSNAARYAERIIAIRASGDGAEVRVAVSDDGPGIPASALGEVVRPFGTHGERGGHGLGLSIVDEITRRHGGRMALDASELGGLCVMTTWPTGEA